MHKHMSILDCSKPCNGQLIHVSDFHSTIDCVSTWDASLYTVERNCTIVMDYPMYNGNTYSNTYSLEEI